VRGIRFGFDAADLLVRIDVAEPARQSLADGIEFDLAFVEPADLKVAVSGTGAGVEARLLRRQPAGTWAAVDRPKLRVAANEVLEVAVPQAAFGQPTSETISFFVALIRDGVEFARYPSYAPITTRVPG
jgi:hypothetical protein